MAAARPKILLLAENASALWEIVHFLGTRECDCFVATLTSATEVLESGTFDLVISTVPLRQQDPIVLMLSGTDSRIFYRVSVEDGCWWVPLEGRGRKVLGSPALRCDEFSAFLESALDQLKARTGKVKCAG